MKSITVMKITKGFAQIPHSILETDKLTFKEKFIMWALIDRANRFDKMKGEFNMSLGDFKEIGINRWLLEENRQKLIDLNLINYRKGIANGKSSTYSLNWEVINSLSNSVEEKEEAEIEIEEKEKTDTVQEEEEQPREDKEIEEQQESGIMGNFIGTVEGMGLGGQRVPDKKEDKVPIDDIITYLRWNYELDKKTIEEKKALHDEINKYLKEDLNLPINDRYMIIDELLKRN